MPENFGRKGVRFMKREIKEGFKIRTVGEESWHPFEVPGSAMTTYCAEGILPDPYYGTNEYEVNHFFENDFEIRGSFCLSSEEYGKENLELVFYGIDTVADLYLNGCFLGHVENMHRIYTFSIRESAREGENELRIQITSPLKFIRSYRPEKGREIHMANTGTTLGSQYIRKPHCMFGWDWGPKLPDAGIFRKIELFAYDGARLLDTYIRQNHQDGRVSLTFETEVKNPKEDPVKLSYQVYDPTGELLYEGEEPSAAIEEPKLWWPNGLGDQPLYRVSVILESERDGRETKEYRIGLRTMEISQEEDQWGTEFAFKVNGKKIFAKGADYIPDDCFYPRITGEVLKRDVEAAVFANFNCLRIWGGGYYPSDEFYDLCDEYGILLWQDLMYACNIYDLTEEFTENIVAEARDNVARFRNHACLALICGNNEMETAWIDWKDMQGHAPSLKRDYLLQFEYFLKKAVQETAPDTFYWPSSPSSGGSFDDPGDENRGDSHYWDVWHGQKPFSEYRNHYFRFCSEFGFQSLPSMKTIESFTEERDRNLFSRVMESHQKNPAANGKILYYLSETFRYPKDLESLVFLSQVLQGYAMKEAVEHFRRNRGRCMGSIYWQFNDNWPVASWSSMDYYGRYKALHYMAQSFYAPLAGSIAKDGSRMEFWISNEGLKEKQVTGTIRLKTLDFQVLEERQFEVSVPALSAIRADSEDYERFHPLEADNLFVEMVYQYEEKGETVSRKEFETFVPMKYVELWDPCFEITEYSDGSLKIQAKSFVPYCMAESLGEDRIWEENVISITGPEPVILRPVRGRNCAVPDSGSGRKPSCKIYDVYHTYAG